MPSFDGSSSRPSRAEADLLRNVLGPARPRDTTLRAASRAYRRSRRRAMLRRAAAVMILCAAFLGSVLLTSQKAPSPAVATLLDPVATGSIARRRDKPAFIARPAILRRETKDAENRP